MAEVKDALTDAQDHFHRQEINGRNCGMGTGVKKMLRRLEEEDMR